MQSDERGAMLIELMVALVVFAVLGSWAFRGESGQLRHVADAFEETVAIRLASGRLEELRNYEVELKEGQSEFPLPKLTADVSRDLSGEQLVRQLEPGLFEVEVRVRWRGRSGAGAPQVVLSTLMERRSGR
jgi:prepilin-type N-terminal cleavage/methylation domain-containing protein